MQTAKLAMILEDFSVKFLENNKTNVPRSGAKIIIRDTRYISLLISQYLQH